ncbi:MAG TPA: ATP-NAD kinase [Thermoplasmatales archaeon]|nr:ATP-NAD kinase [Thermoplasmatales archaeon]
MRHAHIFKEYYHFWNEMKKVGFVVNPIAGMGGRVGLKGTDGVVEKAKELGAKPVAPLRAKEMLKTFLSFDSEIEIQWFTCKGDMGENELRECGIKDFKIVYSSDIPTTAKDTKNACERFLEERVDIILFCGGDGTARDVFETVDKNIPILGIPAGVKMHSGVFGVTPEATAKTLQEFLEGVLTTGDVEILDLDEELYRNGEWKIKLFGTALGVIEPTYVQVGKATFESISDEEIKEEIADYIIEQMNEEKDTLFILGSGSTLYTIGRKLGIDKTLLGIDAVLNGKLVGKDLNEKGLLSLLNKRKKAKLILSPIGAQGFILGRGNSQLSPEVIRKIGLDNIIVVATPSKLASTPFIRVDTGDRNLDKLFAKKEQIIVIIGYRLMKVVKVQTNNL